MADIEHLRAWTFRRQLLERAANTPLDVLERVIGVHGTHPPAPLSLLARLPAMTFAELEKLQSARQIINTPAMRGSVHLYPSSFASPIFAATKSKLGPLLKRLEIDEREFQRLQQKLLPLLTEPIPGTGLKDALGITDHESLAIRMLTRTGDVLRLFSNPRADRLQYVATTSWLGSPIEEMPRSNALSWLAGAYLNAFGPARLEDFAWWAAISRRDAHAAFAELDLAETETGFFLCEELLPHYQATPDLDTSSNAIMPKWDSYTMAYAPDGRARLVDDSDLEHAYTTKSTRKGATTGDGFPLILQQGRAIARWHHRFSGKTMTVHIETFPGETLDLSWLEPDFNEIGALVACTRINIEPPSSLL